MNYICNGKLFGFFKRSFSLEMTEGFLATQKMGYNCENKTLFDLIDKGLIGIVDNKRRLWVII